MYGDGGIQTAPQTGRDPDGRRRRLQPADGTRRGRPTTRIRAFHTRTQALVEAHEGRVVDTAGDSVFGEFDSVVHAVRCAQAIQQTQAAINAALPRQSARRPGLACIWATCWCKIITSTATA